MYFLDIRKIIGCNLYNIYILGLMFLGYLPHSLGIIAQRSKLYGIQHILCIIITAFALTFSTFVFQLYYIFCMSPCIFEFNQNRI